MIDTALPLYQYPSTVKRMRGSIWPKRSSTPCTPKSGEHDDQMAPRDVAPSIAMIVSGMLGMYAATRSPAAMPCASSAAATRDVSACSSACDTERRSLSSPQNTSESPSSSAARRSSRFCAKLSFASGNQRAPGMRSASSSTRSPDSPSTPPYVHISRQKSHLWSIDHCHSLA